MSLLGKYSFMSFRKALGFFVFFVFSCKFCSYLERRALRFCILTLYQATERLSLSFSVGSLGGFLCRKQHYLQIVGLSVYSNPVHSRVSFSLSCLYHVLPSLLPLTIMRCDFEICEHALLCLYLSPKSDLTHPRVNGTVSFLVQVECVCQYD